MGVPSPPQARESPGAGQMETILEPEAFHPAVRPPWEEVLPPHPRLLAMEPAGGMELLQPRGPDSLSGPGPWGTLVFNF